MKIGKHLLSSAGRMKNYFTGPELSHISEDGLKPKMVDVSGKAITKRVAVAQSLLILPQVIVEHLTNAAMKNEIQSKKGPVFSTAIVAGTMAVKNTWNLIPFCHPLIVNACDFEIFRDGAEVKIECTVKTEARTGVEIEAMTGVSVASLTVYDMLKSISPNIVIKDTRLIIKTGGKSDYPATDLKI